MRINCALSRPKDFPNQRDFREYENNEWRIAREILDSQWENPDALKELRDEVSQKVSLDYKGKEFQHEQRTSKFTLACCRYSKENIENFFKSRALAGGFLMIKQQIKNLIRLETKQEILKAVFVCLCQIAENSLKEQA